MNDKLIFFLIILVTLIFTITTAIHYKLPIGEDITFHLDVANYYHEGKSFSEVLDIIKTPYPPLFHYLLLPTYILKTMNWVLFLQIIFYPLALLSIGWIVGKELSWKHAIITVLLLISSYGFFDRVIQVTPQAIDMIFFSLSIYFFLRDKKLGFILSNLVIFYSHSFFGLLLFGAFGLFWLFKKKGLTIILLSLLTFILVIIMTYPVIMYKADYTVNVVESQNMAVRTKPIFTMMYLGGVVVFIPLLLTLGKKTFKNDFNSLVLCWMVVLTPLLFTLTDRYITYAVVPLSILASVGIMKTKGNLRSILIWMVVWMGILLMVYYFYMTLTSSHHIQLEHLMNIKEKIMS